MRVLLTVLAIFITVHMNAQATFERNIDSNTQDLIYKGRVSFYDLEHEPSFKWFDAGTKAYEPEAADIAYLQQELKKYNLVILMGTWCSDSHDLIPRLYKVLKASGYPIKQVLMYGLDRDKKGKDKEEEKYKVANVPTIIVLEGEEEMGRITETVNQSLEADLAEILRDYTSE